MLKHKILITLVALFLATDLFATHYMGGEITWQCLPNGKFRFVMKLYRECNGVTFSASETISVTGCPGLSTIPMNLSPGANPYDAADGTLDGKTDISPNCWSGAMEINCSPQPTVPNTGAIEEWYYTSDAANPTGIQINAVPPASGFVFSHTSCCRNPSSNVTGATSDSWYLRAVMYSFQGRDTYPCYDNSPVFAEVPSPVVCSGYPYTYNYNATDKESDSLYYEWAQALDGSLNTPVTYASGYTYDSPLPGPAQDSANVAAQINHGTGEISYLSYTSGAFVTVTKVSAYRCGIKIAEVFREMQTVLLACPTANNKPEITPPFYNYTTGLYDLFTDTVFAGDVVDFDISAIDMDTLPNGNPNTLFMETSSPDYGIGYTDPASGCQNPPCATLSPAPPMSAMVALSTHFHWQTQCSHVAFSQECNTLGNMHIFYFKVSDNDCPANGINGATISIVVLALPILPPPTITSVDILPNGNVTLNWSIPADTTQSFDSYHIYTSNYPNGPFTVLDSIFTYTQTSYTYWAADGQTVPHYYYLKSRSGCSGDVYSNPGNTAVFWIFNDVPPVESGGNDLLYWNPSDGFLNIQLQKEAGVSIELINLTGQTILRENHNGKQFSIDLNGFSKGIYFVKITNRANQSVTVKKLTVQ